MSDISTNANSAKSPLQFDTAEFGSAESLASELSCSVCRRPLSDNYYEVNGQKICATCKDGVVTARSGSPVAAFLRAGVFGLLAGIIGCGIYYGVLALTGYEVGLIAIAVGLMVGVAVRNGSGHRGGWLYQIMAMVITYGSIVTSYVPSILREFTTNADENLRNIPTAVAAVIAWVIAWFAPLLSLPQNLIGVLIIGFGVYQAWKINKRQPLAVTGPYSLLPQSVLEPPAAPTISTPSSPTS